MSQRLWQIERPDCKCVVFFIFWFLFFSPQQKCQIWVGHNLCPVWNMELDLWMNKTQDWNKSERRVQEGCIQLFNVFYQFYCVCHIFSCIFWQASSWKLVKKINNKTIISLNFAWIKGALQNKYVWQLWDIKFCFV